MRMDCLVFKGFSRKPFGFLFLVGGPRHNRQSSKSNFLTTLLGGVVTFIWGNPLWGLAGADHSKEHAKLGMEGLCQRTTPNA